MPAINCNCDCTARREVDHGPCLSFELGTTGRCVYCDHAETCHALPQRHPHLNDAISIGIRSTGEVIDK